jgi:speckle-type POZ protein
MKAEVFRNLLLFAYTDELPPVSQEEGTAAMAQHLLEAADRYAMEKLKLLCEERL